MLALIVNLADAPRHGRHEIEFEAWQQAGRSCAVMRERLDDPKRLRAAARGVGMGVVPTRCDTSPAEGN